MYLLSPLMQWCGLKLKVDITACSSARVTTDAVVWIEISGFGSSPSSRRVTTDAVVWIEIDESGHHAL